MSFLIWLRSYLVAFIVFVVVDAAWIVFVAQPQYRSSIPALLAEKMDFGAAIVFYCIYVSGVVYFAIRPVYRGVRLKQILANAALFGFFTYSTWALTFKAIAVGVPWSVALADMAWGTLLCTIVVGATVFLLPDTRRLIAYGKDMS